MRFEKYCEIMRTHGIGELFFDYGSKEYYISTNYIKFRIVYTVSDENENLYREFDDFEALLSAELFDGKSLQDIWSDIKITYIDGAEGETDYNPQEYSVNYQRLRMEYGDPQWEYSMNRMRSFFYQLKYVLIGGLILPALSLVFPVLKLSGWSILYLFGGCSVFALLIASIALLKNGKIISYTVTDKKIIAFKGLACETTYSNIKKIKLKKSLFKKGYGSVKIYVKKGLSVNYHIDHISDVEYVYEIISKNLKNVQ